MSPQRSDGGREWLIVDCYEIFPELKAVNGEPSMATSCQPEHPDKRIYKENQSNDRREAVGG